VTDYRARIWRTYIVLLVANQLDVVYTYYGLARGYLEEGNPLLRDYMYTWWPVTLKIIALAILGLAIAMALQARWRHHGHLLFALQAVAAVYAAVVALHAFLAIRAASSWIPLPGGIL